MSLIELARFPDRILGELARGRLAADGIEAELFDEGFGALGLGVMGGVRLMVAPRDVAAAGEALGIQPDGADE
ncbi:putative signal transducing protein [Sphingomonas prati]|uniref:DUF2007 domain-containing protein n=1 Tax=Sphingomonas prati TaxID=1843237 RepID=A0A7W9BS38_9SPHN|nr:DUF2007 domain-containing protein [Sphingomonas prati]MBB5728919.1 hypothetical protein [Sphingomonas prati]GGE86534.1 hypothetical protein GCM10011404_19120 [Sphingomonas prati]